MATFFLVHTPDFLCFARASIGILCLFLGVNPLVPWLYSFGWITDVLDGYIFRHYVKNHPAWHPWNPLPITLDPLCDFVFAISGYLYYWRYWNDLSWKESFCIGLLMLFIAFLLNLILMVIFVHRKNLYTAFTAASGNCLVVFMALSTILAWIANYPPQWALTGAIIAILVFYSLKLIASIDISILTSKASGSGGAS